MASPIHVRAKPGEISERVIVVGDPARAKLITNYLDSVRLVNENRGLTIYTGFYRGVPVTIATHGIGAPSAAIVFEELKMLGAKVLIRLGTCGALVPELCLGDIVIPVGAAYPYGGSALGMYTPGTCFPTTPHYEVINALINEVSRWGVRYFVGPVFSSDAFYAEDPELIMRLSSKGVIAIEMECAVLFALGVLRGFKAGSLLIVSNTLTTDGRRYLTDDDLRRYVDKASQIVLNAITRVGTA